MQICTTALPSIDFVCCLDSQLSLPKGICLCSGREVERSWRQVKGKCSENLVREYIFQFAFFKAACLEKLRNTL